MLLILILSMASFIAGLVDSIAGGGGLLLVPALLIGGIPPQVALGTNKFAATIGTATALINFIRKKKVVWKVAIYGIVFALLGGVVGSKIILGIDSEIVGKIIVFFLPIAIFATLIPKKNSVARKIDFSKIDLLLITPIFCFLIGFYDGFFGPGTGSFFILAFHFILRMDLVSSSATAKVFNFLSCFGALIMFIIGGKVMYELGIPLAIANILGNYVGSHLVIKKGAAVVKIFLVVSLMILLASLAAKYF